ncbi:MAG: GerMN domain-containing protein [Veillonellaceae bacterium]|nr:GerMN domain-containing protein [Veillonellaceae bacterium]
MKRLNMRTFMAALLVMLMLMMAGCGGESGSNKAQESNNTSVASSSNKEAQAPEKKVESTLSVTLYYPDDSGMKIIAVKRDVKPSPDKYTAVMKSLMSGTDKKGTVDIIPKTAKLRSVKVKDGVAKVDFSRELIKDFNGGSTGEEMLVGSIVDTLTEFSEVKKVQILVEGKAVDTIAGHMDTEKPLSRMTGLLK